MAQFGGGQMQIRVPPTLTLCDYCHQKPKLPPYDYCSKACGSRAKASGNMSPGNPATQICKQCGQRPVYKGHEFCGRNCANDWQTTNRHINTGWNRPGQLQHGQQHWNTMPPSQTQNPPGIPTQPIQGFNQGGILKGIVKGLKGLVSQGQQPQQPGPPNAPQQVLGPIPMSSVPMSPGTPNRNWHVNDPNYLPSPLYTRPTCRLNGCNKPVFVDSVTNFPNEYCSQRHREDAMICGQVNHCIMCLRMPRSLNDHFCSLACREKALNQ